MYKIETLILSSHTYPSIRNSKIQKKIFSKQGIKNVYWYKQGNSQQLQNQEATLIGSDLFINASDDSLGMGHKTIKAMEWLLSNSDFDFLFRTNTSSYFSEERLSNYIKDNFTKPEKVYSGLIHNTNDKNGKEIIFASGSGFILSRDVVESIIQNKNLWNHEYWDDVSLAILMDKLNVPVSQGLRFDIKGNPFRQEIDMKHYHYRCRIDNHYGYPRFLEVYVLKYLARLDNKQKLNKTSILFLIIFFEISKKLYIHQFGWKIYLISRKLLRFILPQKIYVILKNLLSSKLNKFKLVRFKT